MQDARGSGQYYVTHELDREMDRIGNGVNHMKLDSDFINSSTEWGGRFDNEALNREKAGEIFVSKNLLREAKSHVQMHLYIIAMRSLWCRVVCVIFDALPCESPYL